MKNNTLSPEEFNIAFLSNDPYHKGYKLAMYDVKTFINRIDNKNPIFIAVRYEGETFHRLIKVNEIEFRSHS